MIFVGIKRREMSVTCFPSVYFIDYIKSILQYRYQCLHVASGLYFLLCMRLTHCSLMWKQMLPCILSPSLLCTPPSVFTWPASPWWQTCYTAVDSVGCIDTVHCKTLHLSSLSLSIYELAFVLTVPQKKVLSWCCNAQRMSCCWKIILKDIFLIMTRAGVPRLFSTQGN